MISHMTNSSWDNLIYNFREKTFKNINTGFCDGGNRKEKIKDAYRLNQSMAMEELIGSSIGRK